LSKTTVILGGTTCFAVINTILLFMNHLKRGAPPTISTLQTTVTSLYGVHSASFLPATSSLALAFLESHSLTLTPASWCLVGGLWIWRGRMKSRWESLGFDSDVFQLFVRMKGAGTRLKVMKALSVPKDRLQLARELGLDWKAIDYQVDLLRKHGFVQEQAVYRRVKLYDLSETGEQLLDLLKDLQAKDEPTPIAVQLEGWSRS
jgi:hypothetical protein